MSAVEAQRGSLTRRQIASVFGPAAWYEKALALLGLLLVLGVVKSMLFSGGDDRTGGSPLFQLVAAAIFSSAIVLLIAQKFPTWLFAVLARAWPLVFLTFLPLISTAWSQTPEPTLRRSIALLLSTSFALYLVMRFDLRTVLDLLAVAFAVFVAVGILAAAIPGLGITPSGAYAGAWRGLSGNKNVFARTVAVGVALLPTAAVIGCITWRRSVLIAWPILLCLLVLSQSATALVAAVTGVLLGLVIYVGLGGRLGRVRVRPEIGVSLLALSAIVGFLTIHFGWFAILEALGRDPTLTGRTKLWAWAIDINRDRSWLGSGYRAFWQDGNTFYFSDYFYWDRGLSGGLFRGPDHSHSGYVDTYLDLGWLGVASLASVLGSALLLLRKCILQNNERLAIMFSVCLVFMLVYSITDKAILQQSEDLWFLFCLFYLFSVKESFNFKTSHKRVPREANLTGGRNFPAAGSRRFSFGGLGMIETTGRR
jgi:exopolysaccharide production protein ExoQ